MTTNAQTFSAPVRQEQNVATAQIYSVGDAARVNECSQTTIRRVSDELKLTPMRTQSNQRIFTSDQVQKIGAELLRREMERDRR